VTLLEPRSEIPLDLLLREVLPIADLPAALFDHLPDVQVILNVLERAVLGQPVQQFPCNLFG
jgi:hypothetical protein